MKKQFGALCESAPVTSEKVTQHIYRLVEELCCGRLQIVYDGEVLSLKLPTMSSEQPTKSETSPGKFWFDGFLWNLSFDGQCIRLPDIDGLRYLHLLYEAPHLNIASSALMRMVHSEEALHSRLSLKVSLFRAAQSYGCLKIERGTNSSTGERRCVVRP